MTVPIPKELLAARRREFQRSLTSLWHHAWVHYHEVLGVQEQYPEFRDLVPFLPDLGGHLKQAIANLEGVLKGL